MNYDRRLIALAFDLSKPVAEVDAMIRRAAEATCHSYDSALDACIELRRMLSEGPPLTGDEFLEIVRKIEASS